MNNSHGWNLKNDNARPTDFVTLVADILLNYSPFHLA